MFFELNGNIVKVLLYGVSFFVKTIAKCGLDISEPIPTPKSTIIIEPLFVLWYES